jgi:LemA protein
MYNIYTMAIYILIGVVVILGLYVMSAYNRFVRLRNNAKQSWSDIEVQLRRRYDLIPNLVETVKGYAAHEEGTLTKVIEMRNAAMAAPHDAAHLGQAEAGLAGALKSVFALSESYPDLKANTNFAKLQDELSDTENKIQAARRLYNATVRDLAIAIQSFPGNIIAGMFGVRSGEFEFFDLPDDDVAQQNVQVKF